MELTAEKSRLKGRVAIPGSKSHTIRAVAIASLAKGTSFIYNPLVSSDTLSAVDCYKALGAQIDTSDAKAWKVIGTAGKVAIPQETIDVGNSGTTLRIAVGTACLADGSKTISFTGDEQIQSRPIGPLLEALNKLGANCRSVKGNGKAPIEVSGRILGGKTTIAALTSQYLTSLLLCAPLAEKDTEIEVTLLNEPGYVQMTLDWLDRQGIRYENNRMKHFKVKGGQGFKGFESAVPADFSSATFFLCAAAIFGDEVVIEGLDLTDSQPDKAVLEYLRLMGANIGIEADSVTVKAGKLKGVDIDMNATPDALPAMAVTAAFAQGRTRLVNVPQARTKETDRIRCMAEELTKMGVWVEELADGLVIEGGGAHCADFHGRGDHRIVMATAIAGMATDGQSRIATAEAMNVTFPTYMGLMKSIGAKLEMK